MVESNCCRNQFGVQFDYKCKILIKWVVDIKIYSGKSRGLNLNSIKSQNLRPTKQRVKESLFDILQFKISGSSFLDLFGGTGQIGIEAFSRNAKNVTIVDNDITSVKTINANVSRLKLYYGNLHVIKSDCMDFIRLSDSKFDIAFLDPPYKQSNLLVDCLDTIHRIMNKNSIIITETLSDENISETFKNLSLKKKYKYGKISLNLYEYVECRRDSEIL